MDYKHRIPGYRPRPRKKSRVGLWVTLALVAGFVAVAIGWEATWRKEESPNPKPEPAKVTATPAVLPNPSAKVVNERAAKAQARETPKPGQDNKPGTASPSNNQPEPRFTFYKILPEKESIIPDSEIKNLKHEESLGKKPPAVQYLLQTGSYTNVQDAEKLKARLSALRIKSHIENVKIENTAWNRVKIGPFTSLAAADGVRTILRNNQIDSIVQKTLTNPTKPSNGR